MFNVQTQIGPYHAARSNRHDLYAICLAAVRTADVVRHIGTSQQEALEIMGNAGAQGLIVQDERGEHYTLVSPDTERIIHPAFRLPVQAYTTMYLRECNSLKQERKRNASVVIFPNNLTVGYTDTNADFSDIQNWYPEKVLEEELLRYFNPYIQACATEHRIPWQYQRTLISVGRQAALISLRQEMDKYKLELDDQTEETINNDINDAMVAWAYLFYYNSNSAKR